MTDDVRRLSDELARDPASLAFLQLGEALRRQGQPDVALRVVLRGLERHAYNPDAHDLLARVYLDRGELERAFDEWDAALRLAPAHAGARKGMAFVLYRQGRLHEAERLLVDAAAHDAADPSVSRALSLVRRALASEGAVADAGKQRPDARRLFADLLADGEQAALLLDGAGLVMAGAYVSPDGCDVGQEVGAALTGVSDEAQRAMRHLALGAWTSMTFEAEAATVAMAPAPDGALVLVAGDPSLPLGLGRRVLARCAARARAWLGEAP